MSAPAPSGAADAAPAPGPRVSVVIPAYKRPELLRKAVESAMAQDFPAAEYEIIVVDSSPDPANVRTVEELSAASPCPLRCLTKVPEGPGPSRQTGVEAARGTIIAFLDSDCQASPSWLREGLAALGDGIGLVQGRTVPDPEGKKGILTWYVSVDEESFFYHCCNIFYRREALAQAGPFIANVMPTWEHPPGGEDVDMAWRVKRLGWKTAFAREALVQHEVVPIGPMRWLVNEQLYVIPMLVARFPELRRFFFTPYFYDKAQALLVLALLGVVASIGGHAAGVVLALPYVAARASEPTATLRGPLRLLRPLIYLPRDLASLAVLVAGSVRFRALVL
jgi:glycosyltransferase involved in cell wall biosynthesis